MIALAPRTISMTAALLASVTLPLSPSLAETPKDAPPIVLDMITIQSVGVASGDGPGGGLTVDGYVAKETAIATKTDTPLRKVPQSVGTVSQQELEDRNVQSLVEAGRYTAGVRAGQFGFDPRFDTLFMRGFNVTDTGFYRDGLRSLGGPFSVFRHEPYTLQGVTLLKGPSSGVYGSGSPGGIVNVISKRPTETPLREFEAQYGSYGRVQGAVDVSGKLDANGNVLYRLTAMRRAADTQFIAARDDRLSIAPSLTWRSDDRNTQFTVLGEFTEFTSGGAAGWYTQPPGFITDYEQGDPRYRDYDGKQRRIGYEFEHNFADNLSFRQNVRLQDVKTDMKYVGIPIILGDYLVRIPERLVDDSEGITIDNQLHWSFSTGNISHNVLAGVDYSHLDYRWRYGRGMPMFSQIGVPPVPGEEMPLIPPVALDAFDQRTKQEQIGAYLQDQIDFDKWTLTVGARYDHLETRTTDLLEAVRTEKLQKDHQLTGRVGLNYQFDNGLSPYVSYSTSFAPTIGANPDGDPFKPTRGRQKEIGLRYAPNGTNLSVDAALFDITQSNTLVRRGNSSFFQDQTGEVTSRGVEVQVTTSVTDALRITAAYSLIDMEYVGGDHSGKFPAGIPDQQFSVWGQYNFQTGALRGLGVGLGARFLDSSNADDANTRTNPSRTLVDASLSYGFENIRPDLKGLTAQISAKNIFDDREVTCVNANCYREEGRSVIGSIKMSF